MLKTSNPLNQFRVKSKRHVETWLRKSIYEFLKNGKILVVSIL